MAVTYTIGGVDTTLIAVDQLAAFADFGQTVNHWLTDMFFPRRVDITDTKVPVALLNLDNPIAPFVSPCVEGRPIKESGTANVQFLQPAYLKPKSTITPCTVYNAAVVARLRELGLIGAGKLSYAESLQVAQVEKLRLNHDSIDNRIELMAAEAFTTGKITIQSDDIKLNQVDFGRDASLTFSPTVVWTDPAATVVADIQLLVNRMIAKGNIAPRMAVMSSAVFNAALTNAAFKAAFITPYAGVSVVGENRFIDGRSAQFMGSFGGIEFWVYDASITHDGTTTRFIPADGFYLVGDTNSVIAYTMIENLEAYGESMQYFDSMWYNKDPSALYLLTESAPLPVLNNPNAVAGGVDFV
ncbi:MAG TPA: major capsid protein [Aquirhabdus sp.]